MRMLGKDDLTFMQRQTIKPEMQRMKCAAFFRHFFRSLSAPVRD